MSLRNGHELLGRHHPDSRAKNLPEQGADSERRGRARPHLASLRSQWPCPQEKRQVWVVPEKSPKQVGSILSLTSALSLNSARASPRCHPPSQPTVPEPSVVRLLE